jgi:hypothetical protein
MHKLRKQSGQKKKKKTPKNKFNRGNQRDLFNENCKSLKREIEEDIRR